MKRKNNLNKKIFAMTLCLAANSAYAEFDAMRKIQNMPGTVKSLKEKGFKKVKNHKLNYFTKHSRKKQSDRIYDSSAYELATMINKRENTSPLLEQEKYFEKSYNNNLKKNTLDLVMTQEKAARVMSEVRCGLKKLITDDSLTGNLKKDACRIMEESHYMNTLVGGYVNKLIRDNKEEIIHHHAKKEKNNNYNHEDISIRLFFGEQETRQYLIEPIITEHGHILYRGIGSAIHFTSTGMIEAINGKLKTEDNAVIIDENSQIVENKEHNHYYKAQKNKKVKSSKKIQLLEEFIMDLVLNNYELISNIYKNGITQKEINTLIQNISSEQKNTDLNIDNKQLAYIVFLITGELNIELQKFYWDRKADSINDQDNNHNFKNNLNVNFNQPTNSQITAIIVRKLISKLKFHELKCNKKNGLKKIELDVRRTAKEDEKFAKKYEATIKELNQKALIDNIDDKSINNDPYSEIIEEQSEEEEEIDINFQLNGEVDTGSNKGIVNPAFTDDEDHYAQTNH